MGRHLIALLTSPDFIISGTSFPEGPEACKAAKGKDIVFLDIGSEKEVFDAVKRARPDWVFHLAAVSNVSHSWKNRRETLETNLIGTLNVFEAVRLFAPKARILFVSSSDVYGINGPKNKALKEEDAWDVVSPYAYTKVGGELLSRFYTRIEGLDIIVARSFPHTGPGQSPDFVCSDWAHQVARIEKGNAEPVIRVGNVTIERDYSDVRDVVKAYVRLLEKGKKGEVYNVCSGKAVKLEDILNTLLSLSDEKIEVQVDKQKLRKADIPVLLGDNRKIKKETCWKPAISLQDSLRDLLDYWCRTL